MRRTLQPELGLLSSDVEVRLRHPEPKRLWIGALREGDFGVLEAKVRAIHQAKEFRRKDGSTGVLRRVTLGDITGEIDLVLWDEEARMVVDGPLSPGASVRLAGATVKPGYDCPRELHLGAGQVSAS